MIAAETPFFLFGLGRRKKFMYKNKQLMDLSGEIVLDVSSAVMAEIDPEKYEVRFSFADGTKGAIMEDEAGVSYIHDGEKKWLTSSPLKLPSFEESPYRAQLRILLHEVLYNITTEGNPLPNLFVYSKPWYRDSALIAMVLKATGNLSEIQEFIENMTECYDKNNAGHCEPDNLGEALYLISCVSDKEHPLVDQLVAEAKSIWTENGMPGLIDFSEHPVYSAKWLKYGLRELGLDDSWVKIPAVQDSYSQLFWMDYKDQHVEGPRREYDELYPYLWWAEKHFYEESIPDEYLKVQYPMSNETEASQANYENIRILSENYAKARNASPHTWHAAEMFLYLYECGKGDK